MSYKKWIVVFVGVIFINIVAISIFIYSHHIPLRFTNSISYDAKLNFLHKTNCLKDADTIVVGSSMALNNISGITLEDNSSKIKKN